jgi:ech hydrogenase subunit A
MLALIGGITFLVTSSIAVSQRNAKKVLAYSTIANLGLIAACAGVGTYEAVWAAILLIIFHALAKSLMFLTVGTVEHRITSRDIEDMEGLILRMPKITVMMIIGIAGMFLAPFGMLISKWATLKAFIDSNPLLVGMVAFGSGVTVFFWSKWMGKLIAVKKVHKEVEGKVSAEEWVVLYALSGLTIGICVLFPLVSHYYVEPFVLEVYGRTAQLGQDNIMIMMLMITLILMTPISLLYYKDERRHLSPYMGGRTTIADSRFSGTLGVQRELSLKNYYLESFFGEDRLLKGALPICYMLIAAMLIFSGLHMPGVSP